MSRLVWFQLANDVRIPGDVVTFISLSDELSPGAKFFSRHKVGYRIGERHVVLALFEFFVKRCCGYEYSFTG